MRLDMFKWIRRIDRFIRFMAGLARVLTALLDALDPPNEHENHVDTTLNGKKDAV